MLRVTPSAAPTAAAPQHGVTLMSDTSSDSRSSTMVTLFILTLVLIGAVKMSRWP
jgi:small neutral amino acid transporter SnatA (MarC family)